MAKHDKDYLILTSSVPPQENDWFRLDWERGVGISIADSGTYDVQRNKYVWATLQVFMELGVAVITDWRHYQDSASHELAPNPGLTTIQLSDPNVSASQFRQAVRQSFSGTFDIEHPADPNLA